MSTYGYWRVSSYEQNEERQLQALKESKIPMNKIFGEKESGKDTKRKELQKMLDLLEPNDLVVIPSIDRLSRNYDDCAELWRIITKEKRADIVVLDMRELLDTRKSKDLVGTLISDIIAKLLSYVAQQEREFIKKRQKEGIEAMPKVNGRKVSKKTGKGFGREPLNIKINKPSNETVSEYCARMGISRSTYYKYC